MKIQDIYRRLQSIDLQKQIFEIQVVNVAEPNKQTMVRRAKNLNAFRNLMLTLDDLPILEEEKRQAKASTIFKTVQDEIAIEINELEPLTLLRNRIVGVISGLRNSLAQLVPKEDESSIQIKLPDPQDFHEAVGFMADIEKVITQNVVNPTIQGRVTLVGWQTGSFWLTLLLGSPAAVVLVGGLASAAALVYRKYKEAEVIDKLVEGLEIKNESLEDLRKGMRRAIDVMIENEAQKLKGEHFKGGTDAEQTERLKLAITTFADLIQKGAEIHPALTAPENVKNVFPDFDKLLLSGPVTKLLTGGETEKSKK